MTIWLVRLTNATLDWAERTSRVAVDCLVEVPVGGLEAPDIASHVQHERANQRSHYARELAYLATEMKPRDVALGASSATQALLVGRVAGDYTLLDEPVGGCRHARPVRWGDPTTWPELQVRGAPRPRQSVRAVAPLAVPPALRAELERQAG